MTAALLSLMTKPTRIPTTVCHGCGFLRVEERLKSGTYSTISMVVSDETLVNRATAVVTVRHFTPLSIPETAKRYAVSPGFTGGAACHRGVGGGA